jgi:SAM-dependent methyltransferase
MDFKQIVKAGYDSIAKRYLEERTQDSEDVRLLDDLISRLPLHAKVLDAGCGAGFPITQILSERFDVTGVDFSEAQIELAKKNVPEANFLCRDMTQLDFPDNTFDGICSYYAIIHIPREEHQSLIENFYRILQPNGYALLCLGAEDLVDDLEENFFGARMYWSHFNGESYLNMLKQAGFSMIWSKRVADAICEGGGHLFVLMQKPQL